MRSIVVASFMLLAPGAMVAASAAVLPEDRKAIDACLDQGSDTAEPCIGLVYKTCSDAPAGSSTAGMGDCAQREAAVWQEKIDASLEELRAGTLGTTEALPWNRPPENTRGRPVPGTDIINDMERTWAAWRAKKCDTLAMQAEGGSLSRVLYGACHYDETARHALWLRALVEDTRPH